jgi:uracil-DNA glycosylase
VPFAGPAGRLLDQALADAGISRPDSYFTNAVKHFKRESRGKRRIHKKLSRRLETGLRTAIPQTIVCLGATAAAAVMGPVVRVLRDRGRFLSLPFARRVLVTTHPSAMLRMPDRKLAKKEYQCFVRDLTLVAGLRPSRTRRLLETKPQGSGNGRLIEAEEFEDDRDDDNHANDIENVVAHDT